MKITKVCLVMLLLSAYPASAQDPSIVESAKLIPSGVSGLWGISVALEGDWALVGKKDDNCYQGAVFFFECDGDDWVERQRITASDGVSDPNCMGAGDWFGWSVSLDRDRAIIGAAQKNHIAGSAYVFEHDGTQWMEIQKISASDAANNGRFGYSVSIEGGLAVVGSPGAHVNGEETGAVYVFEHDGSAWNEMQRLEPSDAQDGRTPLRGPPNLAHLTP